MRCVCILFRDSFDNWYFKVMVKLIIIIIIILRAPFGTFVGPFTHNTPDCPAMVLLEWNFPKMNAMHALWYILLSEFTWLLSCYTTPQPCPHVLSFCFSLCLKISFSSPVVNTLSHIQRLCLLASCALSLSLKCQWGVSELGGHSPFGIQQIWHQSGHMITEQYVTPPSHRETCV